jgi:hypothetical protein
VFECRPGDILVKSNQVALFVYTYAEFRARFADLFEMSVRSADPELVESSAARDFLDVTRTSVIGGARSSMLETNHIRLRFR